jgi:hypothetical protein
MDPSYRLDANWVAWIIIHRIGLDTQAALITIAEDDAVRSLYYSPYDTAGVRSAASSCRVDVSVSRYDHLAEQPTGGPTGGFVVSSRLLLL